MGTIPQKLRLHSLGIAACVLAPLLARIFFECDYASDFALLIALTIWWVLAWHFKSRPWLLWAATAGWMLSCAMTLVTPFWVVAWVALVPLFEAVHRSKSWKRAIASGLIAGIIASVTGFDWVLHGFSHYSGWGNLPSAIFYLPFCLVALWQLSLWTLATYLLSKWRIALWSGFIPAALFALVDWIPVKPSHFYMGYTQWRWKSVIQVTDLTGPPGLAFLIALSSFAAWLTCRRMFAQKPPLNSAIIRCWLAFGGIMVAVLAYGSWRSSAIRALEMQPGNPSISVAAIQADSPSFIPNKDTKLKTDLARRIVRLGATAAGKAGDVDLMVYAESTAPMGFRDNYNPEFRAAYQVVARNSGAWLLVDNVGYTSATQHRDKKFWRECLLLDPDGEIAEVYQKRKLVPVGETLPFEQRAPWLRTLFSVGTNFVAGNGPEVLHLDNVKIAPLVCVEALYENLSRDAAGAGANLLINPANDGWFRSGKQARQHLWGAAFRAVENRIPMIRVANSGHSAAISPAGDIIGEPSPLRTEWTGVWKLNLVSRPGLFSRDGHIFTLLCGLAVIGNILYGCYLRWRLPRA